MTVKIQTVLFLIGMFYLGQTFGQAKQYYLDSAGNIKDEQTYKEQKEKALQRMQAISKSFDVYEAFNQEYNRNDSIVYSYTWHFTDDVERTRAEIERKKSLIGKEYPIENAQTTSGRVINIDDLKGKPTLVNLWFTSCKPCIEEMPVLNKMKTEHGDKFNFLAITFESEARVKKFLKKFTFDFEQIVNSKELTSGLGFEGFPVNLFLDKDGVLRVIEGNVPYEKNENGELEMSDGAQFVKILEGLL